MRRIRVLPLLAAVALFAPDAAAQAPPSDVDGVLGRWEARLRSLRSFKCRFRQEKKVSFMRRPLVSSGTMAFRERRLLWTTETPSRSYLAVGRDEVRLYTPEFRTLEIYPLGAGAGAPGGGPGPGGAFPGLTGDFAALREQYAVEIVPPAADAPEAEKARTRLRLAPKRDELKREVSSVEITLGKELDVEGWRIVRASGDEVALTLSDFEANAEVSDADLSFEVPDGVKVVRPPAGGRS